MHLTVLSLTLLLVLVTTVHCQSSNDRKVDQLIDGLFSNSNNDLDGYVEVPSSTLGPLVALPKCGEESDKGVHVCVPYYRCDGSTNRVISEQAYNGAGLIDIRFGDNPKCEHYLDVCCKLAGNDMREPDPQPLEPTSTRPSATTQPPPPLPPTTSKPSSIRCGIRNSNGIDFKITGNKDNEAEYGEFPWMVALLRTSVDNSAHQTLALCGGSLIAPNVVLTGAHCVADLKIGQYKVRAGEWDTQTQKERLPYQERSVSSVIIHEEYTPKVLHNNVALLILNSPFDLAEHIGTICLPRQGEQSRSRNCLASGWGKDVFGKYGKHQVILKKIELPIVPFDTCERALQTTRLTEAFRLHKSFICAGGEQGKDTCTGDGGSPLTCPDPINPGRYVQTGIVSWGIGCGEKDIPGVYADVARYRNWIDQKLSRLDIDSRYYTI